jgi:hypothetical protein
MKKQEKIPGDIAKIMRKVANERIQIALNGEIITVSREMYTTLLKCNFLEGESEAVPAGFYLIDDKAKTAKLIYSLDTREVAVRINDRTFKVEKMLKGYKYA